MKLYYNEQILFASAIEIFVNIAFYRLSVKPVNRQTLPSLNTAFSFSSLASFASRFFFVWDFESVILSLFSSERLSDRAFTTTSNCS